MTSTRVRRRFALGALGAVAIAAIGVGTGAAAAGAETPPPSLAGEYLTDDHVADIDEATYACDRSGTSTVTFSHSSPVSGGPYPGTLTDHVTVTLGPAEPHDLGFATVERSPILSLEGTFEITGANGTVTGTTTMTAEEAGPANYGLCNEGVVTAQIIASDLSYEALLPNAWQDSGATWLNLNAYGNPSAVIGAPNDFRHSFPTSAGVVPPESSAGDVDGDGVPDAEDDCVDVVDPSQVDTDGDGLGDACDATPNGDADADGIDDGADNCPGVANAAQTDADGDGHGDACDSTPTGDVDGDGVDNGSDNCIDVANGSQVDADGDGLGDACDATPNGDADEDGADDASDNCLGVANAGQTDADGDGRGDACDPTPNGENPPATTDDCKDGGWRVRTDQYGRPFRNQGDCVSWAATGGRNAADG